METTASATNEAVRRVGELIRTQDNRCTAHPLFVVLQKRRIYGMDSEYCDDYVWVDKNDTEHIADAAMHASLDAAEHNDEDIAQWEKVYYHEQKEFVTVCFTEKGCEAYIEANRHNLRDPEIYAASAYRNCEMIAVRNFLQSLP